MNYITGVNCLLRMSLHAGKIGEWHLIETIYNISISQNVVLNTIEIHQLDATNFKHV